MLSKIKEIILIVLAAAGIRLDGINQARILSIILIAIGYGFHRLLALPADINTALVYVVVLFAIRYILLFASFIPKGISEFLISRFGETKGWNIYEIATAVLFWQRGLSFGYMLDATQGSIFHVFALLDTQTVKVILTSFGVILSAIGLWINISATMIIGIDTYYYKDLFLRRILTPFQVAGPYRYFSNPMYGIGQASGYGAALMVGSLEGLLATLMNQVMMYVFYYAIEKPHVVEVLQKEIIYNQLPRVSVKPMLNRSY
jgi:protein-S-isoprenylcysteine O-methyltransferase Ste14